MFTAVQVVGIIGGLAPTALSIAILVVVVRGFSTISRQLRELRKLTEAAVKRADGRGE